LRELVALRTSRELSLGRRAVHFMSFMLTALISDASSPKVAAKASAKSYLLTREPPEVW